MLNAKRQGRVTNEALEQAGPTPESTEFAADLAWDLLHEVRGEVREAAVFQIGPELLGRVEFGGVGWEPHRVPGGMRREPLAHGEMLVGLTAIPQQHDGTREVAVEMREEAPDLRTPDVGFD